MEDVLSLVWLFSLIVLTGCVAGLLSGLFGVGGGIVIVPMLYYIFLFLDYPPQLVAHIAIGTSLGVVMMTQARSARGHYRRGSFLLDVFKSWSLPVMLGAWFGGVIAGFLAGSVLILIFCIGLLLSAIVMIIQADHEQEAVEETKSQPPSSRRSLFYSVGSYPIAFLSALFSAMIGVGGGVFNVSAMHLIFRLPLREAIGTSAGLGFWIGLLGAVSFMVMGWGLEGRVAYSLGYVNVPALLLLLPFSWITSPIGVRWAHQLSPKRLKIAFAIMMILASAYLFYENNEEWVFDYIF